MNRLQLPIGIQSFRTIRDQGFYYVDKTPLIRRLVKEGQNYFLSRPRRFGKSLLMDTIRSLFEGNEELFRDLDIHQHWDWSVKYPVVRLSFDGKYNEPGDVERSILNQLTIIERNSGLKSDQTLDTAPERFQDLLDRLHHATGRQVVVLVDEYDKPILDVLENPDLAIANRDYLRGFYGIIKGSAEHVRFVFVTGVSMFSKVSLFSGLNNLKDISLDSRYATICGYTDTDLDTVFAPELPGLDREEVRRWYNGYHWRGGEKVYNPFDVLLLFDGREFRPWWFETGTPEFLFRRLVEQGVSPMELGNRMTDMSVISKFDVGDIDVDALLFQTGYLTITGEEQRESLSLYRLGYPNFEVQQSLNKGLLEYITRKGAAADQGGQLVQLLKENDFEGFGDRLRSYLAGVPYPWHDSGNPSRYESWYASMLYMSFRTIGVDLRVEEISSHGRADMVVLYGKQVFVLEFKMVQEDGETDVMLDRAISQVRDRGYDKKYRDRNEPIHLLALVFGSAERNLLGVRAEQA